MSVLNTLKVMTKILEDQKIATARLDTLILLEDSTGKDRGWLLAHPEFELSTQQEQLLKKQIERRAKHEPLAYIRGMSEFYGREFIVTPDTLQPRPETETMITLLKNILEHNNLVSRVRPWKLVDVGAGSGCITITAKLEMPQAQVYATELNTAALEIATKNATKFRVDITLLQGNLLEPFSKLQDPNSKIATVILANLPYVPNEHVINESAHHEPALAIFGGKDGLDLYREMFQQIEDAQLTFEYVLTESMPFQHNSLAEIARLHGFTQADELDFIQVFKIT